MPGLPSDLFKAILALLEPHFKTRDDREGALTPLLSGWEGYSRIEWDGDARAFTTRLVERLPIEQLKTVVREVPMGVDHKAQAERLCAALDALPVSETAPARPAGRHIFISYARADAADLAQRLYDDLIRMGYTVWRDRRDLDPYRAFDAEIEAAIRAAMALVVFITPDVQREDSFVRREIAFALEVNTPIIPLKCEGGIVPITINLLSWIAFVDYDAGLRDLRARLDDPQRQITPESRRERELAYLQDIGQRFERWLYLYTDLAGQAQQPSQQPKVAVKKHALKYLNTENQMYVERGYVEEGETQRVETVNELREVVRGGGVVLIGEPGSGKTTTLQRLAYEFATEAVPDEAAPLPVFVPLNTYAGGGLDAHIETYFGGLVLDDYLPGRAVVLLDALNEMPRQFVPEVDAWVRRHSDTLTVVTCRRLDYAALKALPLRRVDVAPLDVFRVRLFSGNFLEDHDRDRLFWALAGEDLLTLWELWREKELDFERFWADEKIDSDHPVYKSSNDRLDTIYNEMRAAMRERGELPGLLGLVTNPFLLTIAIELFIVSGQPPRNRGQLFSAFVDLLLDKRGRPAVSAVHPWIEADDQKAALAHLAYRMQAEKRGTRVGLDWVRTVLDANQLYLAQSATLLTVDETQQEVGFFHQLLQEYFAAYEMAADLRAGTDASKYFERDAWWTVTGWEETAVLLAGIYPAEDGGADAVVRWLTPAQPVLACRAAAEAGATLQPATRQQVQAAVVAAMTGTAPAVNRAEAGRVSNRLGDPRPGVGVRDGLPDMDWVDIPAGTFWMGSGDDEHEVEVSAFQIGRYPVTNAQFQVFIDADDGYNNQQWWTAAGLDWKGERSAPDEYNDPDFRLPNHPRIYVTWYEAVAYCNWLTARYVGAGLIPPGSAVRLPTEAEWEYAARGTDKRSYPYGDEFDAAKGNTRETGIGQTSAVGVFPAGASPFGVQDMSGNVWEWTSTIYEDYPYDRDDGREDVNKTDVRRVLRGGSWLNLLFNARAVFRAYDLPHYRDFDYGFRVVRPPSL